MKTLWVNLWTRIYLSLGLLNESFSFEIIEEELQKDLNYGRD